MCPVGEIIGSLHQRLAAVCPGRTGKDCAVAYPFNVGDTVPSDRFARAQGKSRVGIAPSVIQGTTLQDTTDLSRRVCNGAGGICIVPFPVVVTVIARITRFRGARVLLPGLALVGAGPGVRLLVLPDTFSLHPLATQENHFALCGSNGHSPVRAKIICQNRRNISQDKNQNEKYDREKLSIASFHSSSGVRDAILQSKEPTVPMIHRVIRGSPLRRRDLGQQKTTCDWWFFCQEVTPEISQLLSER